MEVRPKLRCAHSCCAVWKPGRACNQLPWAKRGRPLRGHPGPPTGQADGTLCLLHCQHNKQPKQPGLINTWTGEWATHLHPGLASTSKQIKHRVPGHELASLMGWSCQHIAEALVKGWRQYPNSFVHDQHHRWAIRCHRWLAASFCALDCRLHLVM